MEVRLEGEEQSIPLLGTDTQCYISLGARLHNSTQLKIGLQAAAPSPAPEQETAK